MPTKDEMTIDGRRKYLRKMKKRYTQAHRKGRSQLLDDIEAVTGLHRKSLIRLMKGSLERKPRRKQRGRTYAREVDDALRVIAESFDYLCAERLTPNLVWMATHLAHHGELEISHHLLAQLSQISISTVKRILKRIRQDEPRLPRRKPSGGNRVARDIPMKRIAWNEMQPSHFEVDLVHPWCAFVNRLFWLGCVHQLAPSSRCVGLPPQPPSPTNPVFVGFRLNLTIIILPDPPEPPISEVFLGITFSKRPVLTRVRSPCRYVHTYTRKIAC